MDGDALLAWSPALNLTPSNATDAPAASLAPDALETTPLLDHERLDVFHVALEFAAMVPALTKAARPALRDQIERASSSIALTLAEGIKRQIKDLVPDVLDVIDATDHQAGENPFYT